MTSVVRTGPLPHQPLESLRLEMIRDNRQIRVRDLGTGQRTQPPQRRISDIAQRSLSPPGFCGLYGRLIRHFGCRTIIELGTSLGINAMYLGLYREATVYTFEGAPGIAEVARENFKRMGATNIQLIEGDISDTLPPFLREHPSIDLAFIDANHNEKPTLDYFSRILECIRPESIVIMDDIHLSREMENAWRAIQNNQSVCATADLFRCGIAFFDPSMNKQHVVLQA